MLGVIRHGCSIVELADRPGSKPYGVLDGWGVLLDEFDDWDEARLFLLAQDH